jgi:hypothetical protein
MDYVYYKVDCLMFLLLSGLLNSAYIYHFLFALPGGFEKGS